MALDFTPNEGIYIDSTPLSVLPLTLSIWFNADQNTISEFMFTINNNGLSNDRFCLNTHGSIGGDPVGVSWRDAGSTSLLSTTTGYSLDTWHHACGIWATTTDTRVFLDGGGKNTNVVTDKNPSVSRVSIAFLRGYGDSLFNGSLAEGAAWSAALSDREVAALAKGYSPLLIRPQSLIIYVPMVRGDNNDLIWGQTYLNTGTPDIVPHPRVLYPRK